MIGRKYIVHVSGVGLAVVLTIYATSCDPLPYSEITRIARLHVDPACTVQSYDVQAPELPQNFNSMPYNTPLNAVASSATTSMVSPSFEAPEWES